jgi:hypothetical protein
MKNKFLYILLEIIFCTYLDCQVTKLWSTLCSPYEEGWSMLEASAVDVSGNVYLTGYCSTIGVPNKLFLIKVNSDGTIGWTRVSDYVSRVAASIAFDVLGNVIISGAVGPSPSDIVTKKYSPEGSLLWSNVFSLSQISGEYPVKLKIDLFGYIFVGGGTINNFSGIDFLTLKLNSYGHPLWHRIHSSPGNSTDYLHDLAVDQNGNVIVTGQTANQNTIMDYTTIKYDINGNQIFLSKYYGVHPQSDDHAQSISVDMFGNSYVSGHSGGNGQHYSTAVVKYNAGGIQQWAVRFPDNQNSSMYSKLILDKSSNIWVTEYGSMFKLTPSGTILCNVYDPVISDIAIDNYNNIYAEIEKHIDSNIVVAVNKYNSNGNRIWQYTSNNDSDIGLGNVHLALDVSGNIYVASNTFIGDGKISVLKLSQVIGIEPISGEIPENYNLYQNYPNPFNPATKIRFDIPSNVKRQTSNVKLIVYDVIGREVATLVNEQLSPGTYEVEWPVPTGDGSVYASGVYFYSLITNEYAETKKLILLK